KRVWTLRRMIDTIGGNDSTEPILERLGKTKDNAEFLSTLSKNM
ncbi:MAG: transcription termination factor Rho, partial [Chloroflexi bacterium]|nr:transcription termination factor Rho [Chloroflexota bacterium]